MRSTRDNIRNRRSEMIAYGCVGSAIVFIFALTFGAFESPERPRDVATNVAASPAVSTP